MKQKKNVFTLIEILTVTAIILILAGISVGVVGLINSKNAETRTKATIKALELALAQYKADYGCIYISSGGVHSTPCALVVTKDIPDNLDGTLFKYIDHKLISSASVVKGNFRYFVDGWGRPLVYRVPGEHNKLTFDLGSAGPDGKIGGDKEIEYSDSKHEIKNISDYSTKFGASDSDDITNFLLNK